MKQFALLFALSLFIYSCKKEEPAPTPEPAKTGNLRGKVIHYDQFGVPYTSNLTNITVSIVGRNLTTTTDANGNYVFENTASGTFTLSFTKPGCGQNLRQAIQYNYKDTVTYNSSVADIPSFQITNAYVKDTSWFSGTLAGIYYNANTSPANAKTTLVAIIGKSPSITLADASSYLNFAPTSLINTQDYGRFLSYAFLKQTHGFKKDSTIFVKIYPVANTGSSYLDNVLNKPVYNSYGAAYTTFTMTMPE